jgi:large subunit ribosomal protein L7Ae
MAKPPYVKFEVPKEVQTLSLELISEAKESGKVKKGINETTKSIERGQAKLVLIGEDVDPPEIVMHLPPLCDEKKIPYVYVKKQIDVGAACGLSVGCSSAAVLDPGRAKPQLDEIIKSLEKIRENA